MIDLLLIEDDPGDVRLMETNLNEAFREGFTLEVKDRLERGRRHLQEHRLDLVLLDLNLPDASGLEGLRRLRAANGAEPIVVLTGLEDEHTALRSLREGAQDYLVKDNLDPVTLRRSIRYSLERQRTSAKLDRVRLTARQAEEKWTAAYELAPTGIGISDAETGEIFTVNPACAAVFGYEPEEMIGRTAADLGLWWDPAERERTIQKQREQGNVIDEDVRMLHRSGEIRTVRISAHPLRMEEGDRLLWSVWDVTERVDRERALERSAHALAERVKEQSCLYDVSRFLHDDRTPFDRRLLQVVERIPAGWQYPEVAVARLRLLGKTYESEDFAETEEPLTAAIDLEGERIGELEMGYLEERPEEDVGPFLTEERRLLEEIAGKIAVEVGSVRSRKQMERLADIVENTSDFVGMCTADLEALWINRPGRRMLGVSDEEDVTGTPISEHSPEWAAREIYEEALPAARRDGAWRGESALLTREGEEIPVSQVILAHRDEKGEIFFYSTIARDISVRKEAERRIRESEERYRGLFERSPVPIVISTREGDVLRANDAFLELCGYGREELDRLRVTELYDDPADRERLLEALGAEGEVTDLEVTIRTREGARRIVHLTASYQRDPGRDENVIQVIGHDVTERQELEGRLRHQALHDGLTGLANRTLFGDRLEQAVGRARRHSTTLGLLLLDLDRFSVINDSLGHMAGDRVLQEVGRRLRSCVRQEDTVARWGGDEFCVLLAELKELEDVAGFHERLTRTLGQPIQAGGTELSLEVTLGGVLFSGSGHPRAVEVEDAADLVRYADQALYRAKSTVGASFHLFDPEEMGASDRLTRLQEEQDLRRGLEAGEIEPFYQPLVHLETGEVWGVEPLARWRHPERGLVSPGEFIPLAEESGLIHELGRQILFGACEQVAAWNRNGAGPGTLRVSPNVSGRQFESGALTDWLAECLEASDLDPELVHLEVTETSIMRATERFQELRELGVRTLVDDFGTGYSSFLYLRDLEVDGIKIDMSFVQGLDEGGRNEAIVTTIVTLAEEMGLLVIAEGIETESQLEKLRSIGCGLGQGYLLARPMPAAEMEESLGG